MERTLPLPLKELPKKQGIQIEKRCHPFPVLGFNSGRYDLNPIKEHFTERLADTTEKLKGSKKASTTMFMLTTEIRFLYGIKYLR